MWNMIHKRRRGLDDFQGGLHGIVRGGGEDGIHIPVTEAAGEVWEKWSWPSGTPAKNGHVLRKPDWLDWWERLIGNH